MCIVPDSGQCHKVSLTEKFTWRLGGLEVTVDHCLLVQGPHHLQLLLKYQYCEVNIVR